MWLWCINLGRTAPYVACVLLRVTVSPNDIMAPSWWCCPLLVQTYYAEAVFWVSKLNISDGLFLEPSVSTLWMLCTVCVCVRVCVPASLSLSAITAGSIWPTKSSSHGPWGLSIECCVQKEAIIIGCQLAVNTFNSVQDTYRLLWH